MKIIDTRIILIILITFLTSCNGLMSPPRTKPTDVMETAISDARTSIIGTQTAIPTATLTATPTVIPSPTLTSIPIPTSSVNNQSAISMANECRTTIDEIYQLKKDLELPDHFNNGNLLRQATDFDPNQYFQIFTHLKIKSGYKLDYIYFSDDLGGKPLMYARKSNTAPFPKYEEFLKSYGEEMSGERSYSELHHAFDFLNKIQIDKSYESYYQFIVLTFLGDQFYLSWHGEYNDLKILCDLTDMKYVDEDMKDFDVEFPLDVVNRIEKIDFRPVVVENESTITVRFISFTKWGGFYENIYTVDKEKEPMEFIDIQWNPLIKYDCGISF